MGRSSSCPCTPTARTGARNSAAAAAVQMNEVAQLGVHRLPRKVKELVQVSTGVSTLSSPGCVCRGGGVALGCCPAAGRTLDRSTAGPALQIRPSMINHMSCQIKTLRFPSAFERLCVDIRCVSCVCPGSRVELKTDVPVGDVLQNHLKLQASHSFSKYLVDCGTKKLWSHDPFVSGTVCSKYQISFIRFFSFPSSLGLHQLLDAHSSRAAEGKTVLGRGNFSSN